MQPAHVLFLCSMNLLRSPTAEAVFRHVAGLDVRSAGLDPDAENPCTEEHVVWSEQIFVMEARHKKILLRRFPAAKERNVVNLGIPDQFERMQPQLVDLLLLRVSPFLPVPVNDDAIRFAIAQHKPELTRSACW